MGFSCLFRRSPCGPRLHKEVCHMRQHLIAWMPPPGVGVHPCTPQSRSATLQIDDYHDIVLPLRHPAHPLKHPDAHRPCVPTFRPVFIALREGYRRRRCAVVNHESAAHHGEVVSRRAAPRRGSGSETFRIQTYIGILKKRRKNAEKLQNMREQRIAD